MSHIRRAVLLLGLTPTLALAQADLFTWSGRMASGATFAVRHFNGPIDVREATGDRVEFTAARPTRGAEDLKFEVENKDGIVTICAVWRGRSACDGGRSRGWDWDEGPRSSRLTILLPQGVKLNASTGNGAVGVDRAGNDVEIRTGNGDVRIRLTAGRVDVSTGNGELDIDGATGPVRATTGNGRVQVTTASGPVTARTGNGEIDVRMKALTGDADMSFTTGNGAVTVSLPATFAGDLDASTGRGEFRSDFPIQVSGRMNPRHVRGTIGSGGTSRLRMSSGNGSIELRKSP